jgi:hypothetical protein
LWFLINFGRKWPGDEPSVNSDSTLDRWAHNPKVGLLQFGDELLLLLAGQELEQS